MAFTCIELETRRRQLGLSQTDLGVCIGLLSPKDPADPRPVGGAFPAWIGTGCGRRGACADVQVRPRVRPCVPEDGGMACEHLE